MAASAERARERHYTRPLARPLVGESVLSARERPRTASALGARERNVAPYPERD